MTENKLADRVAEITKAIWQDYGQDRGIDQMDLFHQPDRKTLIDLLKNLLIVLFPGYYKNGNYKIYHISSSMSVLVEDIAYHLNRQIEIALHDEGEIGEARRTREAARAKRGAAEAGAEEADVPNWAECAATTGDETGRVLEPGAARRGRSVLENCVALEAGAARESCAAQELTLAFLETIPRIRAYLETDLQAALDGDPAA